MTVDVPSSFQSLAFYVGESQSVGIYCLCLRSHIYISKENICRLNTPQHTQPAHVYKFSSVRKVTKGENTVLAARVFRRKRQSKPSRIYATTRWDGRLFTAFLSSLSITEHRKRACQSLVNKTNKQQQIRSGHAWHLIHPPLLSFSC